MTPLLAALAVMAVMGGATMVVMGLVPTAVRAAPARRTGVRGRASALLGTGGRVGSRTRLLLVCGACAGALVWLLTGWVVAVLVLPAAAAGLPVLLAAPAAVTTTRRVEAMEEWTRGLAGVLTVGVGLEQAIIATLRSTPDAITVEVSALVARLRARWATPAALRAFAEDLDDATGDLIASSLILGSTRRGAGLASVLQGLAATVAEDVRIRRAIEADRAKPRATARAITLITVAALGLLAFNGDYIAPYKTTIGQLILVVLLGAYAGALVWMRKMAQGVALPRFLGPQAAGRAAPR